MFAVNTKSANAQQTNIQKQKNSAFIGSSLAYDCLLFTDFELDGELSY